MPIIFSKKTIKQLFTALFVSIVVAIVIAYRYHFFYLWLKLITPKTANPENNAYIKELHPIFGYKISKFIKELEKNGAIVKINSGFRSIEKQQELYNTEQTTAKPLNSYHNYGLAIDMNVDNLLQASSVASWQKVANLGKQKYGLRWGGDFSGNWDKVHFDLGNDYKIEQLKSLYEMNELVNKKFVKIF